MLRKTKKLAALLLAVSMSVGTVSVAAQPATVYAATQTYTIRLTKVTDSVAKKVYTKLMSGQEVVVKFANGNNFTLFSKLRDRIAKKYSYGVYCDFEIYDNFLCFEAKQAKTFAKQVKKAKTAAEKKQAKLEQIKASAVTSGSEALAQDIHDTLMTKKAYTFYTKGKPQAICKDLIKRIQKLNTVDVLFKYETKKVSGTDCYQVVIDQEHAEAYYWAVKISEKEFAEVQNGIHQMILNDIEDQETPGKYDYEYYFNDLSPADRLIMNTQSFGELSDIMKLYLISGNCMFSSLTSKGICYTKDSSYWTTTNNEATVLRNLYKSEAYGVCEEFAKSKRILFSYWGINSDYCTSSTHAWTEGVATNSKGEKVKFKFDYKLETIGSDGKFSTAGGYRDCLN